MECRDQARYKIRLDCASITCVFLFSCGKGHEGVFAGITKGYGKITSDGSFFIQ